MRYIYITLAVLFSLFLCSAVGRSTPPGIAPILIISSRALALICLVGCGIAIRNWKIACALIVSAFMIYLGLAITQGHPIHECAFVIKCTAGIGACLGAAAREDKEEEANDKDVPLAL